MASKSDAVALEQQAPKHISPTALIARLHAVRGVGLVRDAGLLPAQCELRLRHSSWVVLIRLLLST